MRRSRTTLALMAGIALTLAAGTTLASAAVTAPEDGADTYNVAPGTTVTGTNSGNATFTIGGGTITITCTLATFSGKTGTTLKIGIAPPVFADAGAPPCIDNVGGTDTFASSGKWSVKEKDQKNDEGLPEPNATGDTMIVAVPKAGLVDHNNLGCTVTFAPTAASSVKGKYDDAGTLAITGAAIPVSVTGGGCPITNVTSVTLSVTYTLSPAIFDMG